MEAYAILKYRLCCSPHEATFFYLHLKKSSRYSTIRALDPALHLRLKYAQQ